MAIEGLLTTDEVATLIGRSRNMVAKHIQRGTITAQSAGKIYLIAPSELDKLRAVRVGRPKKERATDQLPVDQ